MRIEHFCVIYDNFTTTRRKGKNRKLEFLEKAAKIFPESKMEKELHAKGKTLDEERNDLMAKVGQLTIENDWLKKIWTSLWTLEKIRENQLTTIFLREKAAPLF